MEGAQDVIDELGAPTRELRQLIPDTWAGFAQMHRHAIGDGAVSGSMKELVALALGVAQHCDGCVAYHARAAAQKGATREEVAEVLGVTLLMCGGPATVWAPRALAAFDEFAAGDP